MGPQAGRGEIEKKKRRKERKKKSVGHTQAHKYINLNARRWVAQIHVRMYIAHTYIYEVSKRICIVRMCYERTK